MKEYTGTKKIKALSMQMLGGKAEPDAPREAPALPDDVDDNLPF